MINELQRKATLQKIGKKTGLVCCRKCGRELGKLEWLKKRNTTYFINNIEFLKNNDCQLKNTYENFQENLRMGKYLCHFIQHLIFFLTYNFRRSEMQLWKFSWRLSKIY